MKPENNDNDKANDDTVVIRENPADEIVTPEMQEMMDGLIETFPSLVTSMAMMDTLAAHYGGRHKTLYRMVALQTHINMVLRSCTKDKPENSRRLAAMIPSVIGMFRGDINRAMGFWMQLDARGIISVIDHKTGAMINTDNPKPEHIGRSVHPDDIIVLKPSSLAEDLMTREYGPARGKDYAREMFAVGAALSMYEDIYGEPYLDAEADEFVKEVSEKNVKLIFNDVMGAEFPGNPFSEENKKDRADMDVYNERLAHFESLSGAEKKRIADIVHDYHKKNMADTNEAIDKAKRMLEARKDIARMNTEGPNQ